MYYLDHETKTTSWEDPRQTIVVAKAEDQDSISSLHDYGDLFKMFNIKGVINGQTEDEVTNVGKSRGLPTFTNPINSGSGLGKPTGRGQPETLFSASPSSETRTLSPISASGSEEWRNVDAIISTIDQVLAPLHPSGVDQILTADSAPAPQSPHQDPPSANLATLPPNPETRKAPSEISQPQRMTTGEPSATSLPSRKPENPSENAPQGQNATSKSSLPSSRSNATSKATNKATTRKSGAKSGYKPRVTLAKGPDPRLRKGPNDSLLLMGYGDWEGPDPALRRGPQMSNVKGPNPLNRS